MRVDPNAGKGKLSHVGAANQDGASGAQTNNDRVHHVAPAAYRRVP